MRIEQIFNSSRTNTTGRGYSIILCRLYMGTVCYNAELMIRYVAYS